MEKFRLLTAALAIASAIALAACGNDTTGGGTASAPANSSSDVVIGIVAKSQDNPVFQAAHKGALDAAEELSKSTGKHIVVKILTPPTENPQQQADAIDSLVRSGAQGIAVSCTSAGVLKSPIDKAVDKGVVVMCFDSDSPESKRLCYYGTDDEKAGQLVMKKLAAEMGDKGVIAVLAGNEAAPNLRRRVDGVLAELKNHPGITQINSGAIHHKEDAASAAQALQDVQRAHKEITGWALVGGWPLFTANALPWKPGEIKLVSVDALPDQISYLASGHVNVLLAQDCYGWGHKSVEILVDKLVNKKDPSDKIIIDPLTEVNKSNAEEWSKKWVNWMPKK